MVIGVAKCGTSIPAYIRLNRVYTIKHDASEEEVQALISENPPEVNVIINVDGSVARHTGGL
jgi:hypothetical protein